MKRYLYNSIFLSVLRDYRYRDNLYIQVLYVQYEYGSCTTVLAPVYRYCIWEVRSTQTNCTICTVRTCTVRIHLNSRRVLRESKEYSTPRVPYWSGICAVTIPVRTVLVLYSHRKPYWTWCATCTVCYWYNLSEYPQGVKRVPQGYHTGQAYVQ